MKALCSAPSNEVPKAVTSSSPNCAMIGVKGETIWLTAMVASTLFASALVCTLMSIGSLVLFWNSFSEMSAPVLVLIDWTAPPGIAV